MKKYNLKFEFWNINVDPIKEKEANKIIWILSQTRHVKDISFAINYKLCSVLRIKYLLSFGSK